MKIIGRIEDNEFLISASRSEIANLLGAYSQYSLKEIGMTKSDIKPGLEINVSGAYEKLYWLEKRRDEFKKLERELESALKGLRKSEPLFKKIIDAETNP